MLASVGASYINGLVSAIQGILSFIPLTQVSLTSAGNYSAYLAYSPWYFGLIPDIRLTVSNFQLDYKFGHLVPVFATIQPPSVTVDPAPFAFLAAPSLNASPALGQPE